MLNMVKVCEWKIRFDLDLEIRVDLKFWANIWTKVEAQNHFAWYSGSSCILIKGDNFMRHYFKIVGFWHGTLYNNILDFVSWLELE